MLIFYLLGIFVYTRSILSNFTCLWMKFNLMPSINVALTFCCSLYWKLLGVRYWKHREVMDFVQSQVEKVKNFEQFAMNFSHLNTMQVQYRVSNDCLIKLCWAFLTVLNCLSTIPLEQGDLAHIVCSLMMRAS